MSHKMFILEVLKILSEVVNFYTFLSNTNSKMLLDFFHHFYIINYIMMCINVCLVQIYLLIKYSQKFWVYE